MECSAEEIGNDNIDDSGSICNDSISNFGNGSGVLAGQFFDPSHQPQRSEFLEYLTRKDGSCVCKLCGEVLPSRTHWYRHKYKLHMPGGPATATLYKCSQCNVFFKSRKGYLGHVSSRHSELEVATGEESNISATPPALPATPPPSTPPPTISTNNSQTSPHISSNPPLPLRKRALAPQTDTKTIDYEKRREQEEKLVADIIDRVRRECEAQGAAVSRRGYTRRTTVMNSS